MSRSKGVVRGSSPVEGSPGSGRVDFPVIVGPKPRGEEGRTCESRRGCASFGECKNRLPLGMIAGRRTGRGSRLGYRGDRGLKRGQENFTQEGKVL